MYIVKVDVTQFFSPSVGVDGGQFSILSIMQGIKCFLQHLFGCATQGPVNSYMREDTWAGALELLTFPQMKEFLCLM